MLFYQTKRNFLRLSCIQSMIECAPSGAREFKPMTNCERLAVPCEPSVVVSNARRSVTVLCRRIFINPPAILWRIVSVTINAVYIVAFRSRTHVGVEVFKRVKPSWAYFNASSPVAMIRRVVRIRAAVTHRIIDIINRMLCHPVRYTRLSHNDSVHDVSFMTEATATSCSASRKPGPIDYNFIAAITQAFPLGSVFYYSGRTDNNQTGKALTC